MAKSVMNTMFQIRIRVARYGSLPCYILQQERCPQDVTKREEESVDLPWCSNSMIATTTACKQWMAKSVMNTMLQIRIRVATYGSLPRLHTSTGKWHRYSDVYIINFSGHFRSLAQKVMLMHAEIRTWPSTDTFWLHLVIIVQNQDANFKVW